ncbi:folate-binding protein [Magnetovibrio sp. PR-2]|uniref:CAF17-like 4Fe-4S cluster assembly/insertion protein YgfZ n=1 Tax=Magnetovibrio sp. PR-2 TaxID=3120356 RepID=UPI002FCE29B5
MSDKTYIHLPARGLIKVSGPDARDFLQGLVSQDMQRVTGEQAVYSAFLSPQGKFLFDFFAFEMDGAVFLDVEAERRSDFFKRLSMYKLRSDVELTDETETFDVYGVLDSQGFAERGQAKGLDGGVIYADPRLLNMGCRAVLSKGATAALEALGLSAGDMDSFEAVRIGLGLADGSRDMTVDRALLLENGFEELDGVDFGKGCFMGQELTARTRYRGLVKKRLLPVTIDGPVPEPGTAFELDGKAAGEMKSTLGNQGLAVVRLDQLSDGVSFTTGDATITPTVPDWVVFQEKEEA